MKTKYPLTITLMAFLALLLTGCGGSSSTTMQERAASQTAELKDAYDKAKAALDKLQDDTSDATEAEVVAVEEALETLKEKIVAAKDVSDEVKAMYSASAIETGLAEAKATIRTAIGDKAVLDAIVETAKTASTNADTAADGAETETMGVVMPMQVPEAKSPAYAKESRTAATMAMEEYEKARTAAAAGNRTDAEAARRKAEEQAQIATDKAAAAKKAAPMELKYSDGTYSVGEISITPAELTKEGPTVTVNGATVKTGLTRSVTARHPGADVAAITASGNTKAKPKIERRTLTMANYYNDSTGRHRFVLYDRYRRAKTVNAYRATTGTITATVSDAAPNGAVDHDSDDETAALIVMKATGDFYMTNGSGAFDNTNPASATIEAATKKADAEMGEVYYYTEGSEKKWLQRDTTYTGTGYRYKNISVVENVEGFPVEKAYSHMNFGLWSKIERPRSTPDTYEFTDMGIAFVQALPDGDGITGDDMPTTGTVTYEGWSHFSYRAAHAEGKGVIKTSGVNLTVTANFETNSVTMDNQWLFDFEGTINGSTFKGTKISGTAYSSFNLQAADKYTGSFQGAFFGPEAAEVGGVFDYTSEGKKAGEFRGAFGADKSSWER